MSLVFGKGSTLLSPTIHHSTDTGHRGIAVCAMDDQIFMTITLFLFIQPASFHRMGQPYNLNSNYMCATVTVCSDLQFIFAFVIINVVHNILIAIYKTTKVCHETKINALHCQ